MSAEILAAPDSSFNVRFSRRENRGEGEEMEEEILEDEEHHADLGSQQARPNTEQNGAAIKRRCFRAPAVTLGVMYLLILAGIYIRYILVTVEKDQLQNRYNTLNTSHTQLQETFSEKRCPDGWTRFGCSCYFRSNGMKLWYQSRTDCQSKGADLVVINSEDENKFVSGLNMYGQFWIGLKTELSSDGRSYEWKWVDGSPLTETFWAAGLQRASSDHYAAYSNQHGRWTQSYHVNTKPYICEKQVSCIL
ncbi:C-type lectin domain family 6 member A-like isoform 2-T2 [Acanthopagrus schlegelii]